MFFRLMEKEDVAQLVRGLSKNYEVVGPQEKRGEIVFDIVEDADDLQLAYTTTLLPPKKYFTHPHEELLRYNRENGETCEPLPDTTKRVIFGMHPCDINAQLRLDKVFLGDFEDAAYRARRENTLIIGVSCVPGPACLCTAMGSGEVTEGYDLFLTDLGDRYFVTCQTVEGANILDKLVKTREVTPQDTADFQEANRAIKEAIPDAPEVTQLPLLLDAKYHDELWEEIGDACLSCGACSAVCPTCYCFDVNDLADADGVTGTRERTWDSCNFSRFAEVAGGHNFRDTRSSRVRYRFYHKFWGYLSRFGVPLCVGCGRCNAACKVNINPRRVIEALAQEVRS